MLIQFEKQQFKMLVVFSPIFVVDTVRISRGKDLSSNQREIQIIENLSNSNLKLGKVKVRIRETVELGNNELFFSSGLSVY